MGDFDLYCNIPLFFQKVTDSTGFVWAMPSIALFASIEDPARAQALRYTPRPARMLNPAAGCRCDPYCEGRVTSLRLPVSAGFRFGFSPSGVSASGSVVRPDLSGSPGVKHSSAYQNSVR
jgi:hypothetical protein